MFWGWQIDVDVGSSSVARSVCGLVLGYATTVVIDFAMLIEVCMKLIIVYLLLQGSLHRVYFRFDDDDDDDMMTNRRRMKLNFQNIC